MRMYASTPSRAVFGTGDRIPKVRVMISIKPPGYRCSSHSWATSAMNIKLEICCVPEIAFHRTTRKMATPERVH
jgi:hypothetical protein